MRASDTSTSSPSPIGAPPAISPVSLPCGTIFRLLATQNLRRPATPPVAAGLHHRGRAAGGSPQNQSAL